MSTVTAIKTVTPRTTVKSNGQTLAISSNPLEAMVQGFKAGLAPQAAFKRGSGKAGKALDAAWEATQEAAALAHACDVLKSALSYDAIENPLAIDTDESTDESTK